MPDRSMTPINGTSKDSIGVIILGAGESHRMNGVDKIFSPLRGLPLIGHSIQVFNAFPHVTSIILVLSSQKINEGRLLSTDGPWHKIKGICLGGSRRQDSVRAGLDALEPCSWVMIHDGARPLVEPQILQRALDAVHETGAAVAAIPTTDTIKIISDTGSIKGTPAREHLWMVQTPQIFRHDLLMEAHRRCEGTYTDDSAMVESLGHEVKVFLGSHRNLKITRPDDLVVMEALLDLRKGTSEVPCL